MRPIKFRAWDKDGHKMVQWEEMYGIARADTGVGVHLAIADHCYLLPEDCELMQFTGLLDRDGVEIYEGDICVTEFPGIFNGVIVYCAPEWLLQSIKSNNLWSITVGYLKVIGNIYENVDLLKGE